MSESFIIVDEGATKKVRVIQELTDKHTPVIKISGPTDTSLIDPRDAGSRFTPLNKAGLFNTALPAAEANLLAAAISPTNSPSYLRIYVCISVAGVFRVVRTQSAVTVTENLNALNGNLVADGGYMFTVPWRTGDTINFRYSVTAGTIKCLQVDEIGAAE